MTLIRSKLEGARQELLDLGLRNPLINYRTLKARGVEVVDELPREVFRLLVAEGKALSFLAAQEEKISPVTETTPKSEPQAGPESDTKAESEAEAESETGSTVQTASGTQTESGTRAESEIEAGSERPAELESEVGLTVGVQPESEGRSEPGTEIETAAAQPVSIQPQPGAPVEQTTARHQDSRLQTPYPAERLESRLLKTFYEARTYVEERGVNILYLCLGMLEWYESTTSTTKRRAPLILIPVELTRSSVQARFHLRYTGDDLSSNISLQNKLKAEFGVTLPELPDASELDVESYLQECAAAVSAFPTWRVDKSAIALGFFLFGKLLMYHDLDTSSWSDGERLEEHPVLRSLLEGSFPAAESRLDDNGHLDDYLAPQSTYHVVDADSSQILAMLDVEEGHNLVIQGPPGTGKSQTITNIIAEALGKGRSVLFVAEKMAALEVVKRRLDAIHLGDACLELHSHKAHKKALLDELERTLALGKPKVETFEQELGTLQTLKRQLNDYCAAVNERVGASKVTPYLAYGHMLQLQRKLKGGHFPRLEDDSWQQWSAEEFAERRALVDQLQRQLQRTGVPVEHPFWGSRRKLFSPTEKFHLAEAISLALRQLGDIESSAEEVAAMLHLPVPQNRSEVYRLVMTARRVVEAPAVERIQLTAPAWSEKERQVTQLLEAGMRYHQIYQEYSGRLIPQIWDPATPPAQQNVALLRQPLEAHGRRWWRVVIPSYRAARKGLQALTTQALPKELDQQLAMVDAIVEAQKAGAAIDALDLLGEELFGRSWAGRQSDWPRLHQLATWTQQLHADIEAGKLPKVTIQVLKQGISTGDLRRRTEQLHQHLVAFDRKLATVLEMLELDTAVRPTLAVDRVATPLAELRSFFQSSTAEIDRLQEMVAFNHLRTEMEELKLHPVLELAAEWSAASTQLANAFVYNWHNALLQSALQERPALARFDGATQSQKVEQFRELDQLTFVYNRARLALNHWQNLPKQGTAGQLGVLTREFQKKRRHLPIRQLMQQAGRAIQAIKPVFMMSPMSVATYLPAGSVSFDLVIFDEASQVKPVDAFGAIVRGKQSVVVGDSKQLPPTRFFDAVVEVDEEEETLTGDLESILGLFLAQGSSQRMLRWHYRSRHESLIAVSNYEFYNNQLVTFPSPDVGREQGGLIYHYVPGEYDRGRTSTNRHEAEAIAQAVMHHARRHPEWTLGVATFSTQQREAVLEQVEAARRQDPACEAFFNSHPAEPFFVKNLENVQGDERDVIFISIGYGVDERGVVSMNFGPLNQQGGERRLNVLITRARLRCEVFTNLSADDIDLSRTSARGVAALRRFLQYAQTGHIDAAVSHQGEADAPFEKLVAEALQERGYQVDQQVGSAAFRVDLAVVDPEKPGRYLLGIECDGATYQSARTTRDRDRIRQAVLRGLGWQIYRVWSTDWFHNPGRELAELVEAIEAARKQGQAPAPLPVKNSDVQTLSRGAAQADVNPSNAAPYVEAQLSARELAREIQQETPRRLGALIRQVVEVESPVHVDLVVGRILALYGVSRMGSRIRDALLAALMAEESSGRIQRRGDFLFDPKQEKIIPRDRSQLDSSARKFEWIAPEEIAAAIEQVIAQSYGIDVEQLPGPVGQIFGFTRTSDSIRNGVQAVVQELIVAGRVVEQGGQLRLKG
jgi:very-short-patch-repair endonuclease